MKQRNTVQILGLQETDSTLSLCGTETMTQCPDPHFNIVTYATSQPWPKGGALKTGVTASPLPKFSENINNGGKPVQFDYDEAQRSNLFGQPDNWNLMAELGMSLGRNYKNENRPIKNPLLRLQTFPRNVAIPMGK